MTTVSALPSRSDPMRGLRDDRPADLVAPLWSRLCAWAEPPLPRPHSVYVGPRPES